MNKTQFNSFIDSPDKMSGADAVLLSGLVKNFPYFQTAHLLYAKSLHNQHSIHYNNQLKITAAYATDRRMLHRLITKRAEPVIVETLPVYLQADQDKHIREEVVQIVKEEVREQHIPVTVVTQSEKVPVAEKPAVEIPPVLPEEKEIEKEVPEKKDDTARLEREYIFEALNARVELEVLHTEPIIEEQPETIESDFVLNTTNTAEGEPSPPGKTSADFTDDQPRSFSEWLQYAGTASSKKEGIPGKSMSAADLIDKFIKEEPKITKPKAFFNPVNMAKQSVAEDITFVSETLAKIYVMQGNYEKALDAYENLRLKYPEKRLYFAAQIKNLRKLINQQNNK